MNFNNVRVTNRTEQTGSKEMLKIVQWRRALQYAAAFTAALTFLMAGTFASWTSPTLPKLEEVHSHIPITRDQGSWIVSLLGVGGILAPLPAGYLVNKYGRRPLLIFSALPFLLAWLLIIFARSAVDLMVSRTVCGLGAGIAFAVCPIYLGEIAEDSVRGILGTLMQLMMNLGSMFEYSLGPYVSYTTLGVLSSVFPVVFLVLMFFMPESPYFLLMQDRRDEAEIALMRLRGQTDRQHIQEELARIQNVLAEQMKEESRPRDLIATRGTRRALVIMIGLILIQQFGGIMAILSNAQDVFEITPGSSLSSSECAIVVGGIQTLASISTSSLVDRLGRRPLLLTSTFGCAASLVVMGAYQYIHLKTDMDTAAYDWLPLLCLVVFLVTYSLGIGPLPIAMMGEMFPSNVKGVALSIGAMLLSFCFVLVTKLYQVAVDGLGAYFTFWFFAGVSTVGIFFVFFLVPETKGKSLGNIVLELNGAKPEKHVGRTGDQQSVFTIST
ncbi:Sugar transporter ERD6-like 6 [Zootermopsis nevadensis]|uniref:Sugar transporter ERD6-like 6 n=3 Tax=Zootermopsis nevadensis TaxID=136037 RepID=A0A067R7D8_ZOONE|nr:Sugar transporter ERD6-like 6 [Zootermopsis nevadensis]